MKKDVEKKIEAAIAACREAADFEKGTAANSKDLVAQKDFLASLDWSSLDAVVADKLKAAIITCAESLTLFKSEEVRKLWSLLLTSEEMSNSIHQAMKLLMPEVTKKDARLFGEIYFKAWKSSEEAKEVVQLRIQDIMHCAVLAKNNGLTEILRTILSAFVEKKEVKEVDHMLVKLLNPILWRHLVVPSAIVRRNSAKLLFLMFPLRIPDAKRAEQDELLNQQCDHIERLRNDEVPSIRALAILETFKICNYFWSVLPSQFLTNTFMSIQKLHAYDKASPESRVAVYCGIRILVDNPRSHLAIKKLLQNIALHGLNDVKEKVRLAVVKVLLKLRGLKTIKFWEVIQMSDICERLGVEKSTPVRRALVELIAPSFCPRDKGLDARLQRALALYNPNFPLTTRNFFKHLHEFIPFEEAALQLQLMTQGVLAVARKMREEDPDASILSTISGDGDTDAPNAAVPKGAQNPETVRILLDHIAVMLTALGPSLAKAENAAMKAKLFRMIGKSLQSAFSLFEDEETLDCLIAIGSQLPPNAVPYISKQAIKKLKTLEDDEVNGLSSGTQALIQAVCSWKGSELLEIMRDWLEGGWSEAEKTRRSSVAGSKRKVKFTRLSEPELRRPFQAVKYLECALNQPLSRQLLLEEHRPLFEALIPLCSSAKDVLRTSLVKSGDELGTEFPDSKEQQTLLGSLRLFFTAQILKSEDPQTEICLLDQANGEFCWLLHDVLENVLISEFSQEERKLCIELIKVFLEFGYHLLILKLCGDESAQTLHSLCRLLLNSYSIFEVRAETVRLVYQLCLRYSTQDDGTARCDTLIQDILILLSKTSKSDLAPRSSDYGAEFGDAFRLLLNFLCIQYPEAETKEFFAEKVLCSIVGACIAETLRIIEKEGCIRNPSEEEFEYPPMTEFLLKNVILKDRNLTTAFISALEEVVESGGVDKRPELALKRYGAVLQMLFILDSGVHTRRAKEVARKVRGRIATSKERFSDDAEQMAELACLMDSLAPPSRAKLPSTPPPNITVNGADITGSEEVNAE